MHHNFLKLFSIVKSQVEKDRFFSSQKKKKKRFFLQAVKPGLQI